MKLLTRFTQSVVHTRLSFLIVLALSAWVATPVAQGGNGWILSLALSRDGRLMASGDKDGRIRIWDFASGKEVRALDAHKSGVNDVTFDHDVTLLASASKDNTVKLWDLASGRAISSVTGYTKWVRSVGLSPDGKRLLAASGALVTTFEVPPHNEIHRWVANVSTRMVPGGEVYGHVCAVFSPNGKTVAAGDSNGKITILDGETFTPLGTLNGSAVILALAFSADGTLLVTGNEDRTVTLWDLSTGDVLRTIKGHSDGVYAVAFSPDKATVASAAGGEDATVKLWNVGTGQEVQSLKHNGSIHAVTFTPDSKSVISGGQDGLIRVWDSTTGKLIRRIPAESGLIK